MVSATTWGIPHEMGGFLGGKICHLQIWNDDLGGNPHDYGNPHIDIYIYVCVYIYIYSNDVTVWGNYNIYNVTCGYG